MENPHFICGKEKYAYGQGYLAMPISIEGLPPTISVNGEDLYAKSDFHVSLLCVKKLVRKHGPELEEKLLTLFCSFTTEYDISLIQYTNTFRFAETNDRKTIVALCEVSNLEKFFELARVELKIFIHSQPTHVTLYTLQPELGIGLNSEQEMREKTRAIEVPDALIKILHEDADRGIQATRT